MTNGKIKNTINRAVNRKKRDPIETEIVKYLSNFPFPKSTQEIADGVGHPWHSIQTRCLRLQINNELIGFRVGRINLWQIKNE